MKFLESIYRQIKETENQSSYFPVTKYDRDTLKRLYQYSSLDPPYDKIPKEKRFSVSMSKSHWSTPNTQLVFTLYKIHKALKSSMRGGYASKELGNIWIVKAASNARGLGIYVTDKLSDILPKRETGNKGKDRLVMKYIENPLTYPIFNNNLG